MPRRAAALALLVTLVVAGCQMKVDVATSVQPDGSGTVTIGVGLDDDALARAGNLDQQLRVDDLRAAGWEVVIAGRGEDGYTWVRATKPFADPAGFSAVMQEVTGANGPFRDFTLARDSSLLGTDYRFAGTVDLTGGPAAFSDPEVAATLGGDPFGGTLASVEHEEGRPASQMVDFTFSVDLPGASAPKVWTPSFADSGPTKLSASSSQRGALAGLWIVGIGVVVLAIVLVVLRRAFRHRHV